ncbi:myosin heavy chain, striated muscle-like [Anguilla anguilla]|uniref:myosin heavy chain, striated muscle-like n=1 Tax=Anguilla anguilla TaxID=7936 RepID=UPI0015B3789F|nr:myosin heavy chain, striated muscle-like [Anguilla anguilla]
MVKSKKQKASLPSKAACKKGNVSGLGHNDAEADSDNEGESEVLTLQRVCHRLDVARQVQEREAQTIIRRQRKLIGRLREEREELLLSPKGMGSGEDRVTRSFNVLLKRSDELDDLILRENVRLRSLDREIHDLQRKMDAERKGLPSTEDASRKIQRLTSQIAQVNCRLGSLVSTNCTLRQDIQTMRGEKERFLRMKNRLGKELQNAQKKMGILLDEANEYIHMREESQARTARAQDQRIKEAEQREGELTEIQRALSHAQKEGQFLWEKTKQRERDRNFLRAAGKKEARAREVKVEQRVVLNQYEEAVEKIGELVDRVTRKRVPGGQRWSRVTDQAGAAADRPSEDERRRMLWGLVSRRRSTLVSPMFREALGGEGEVERRGRRLTEHRRRSTLLAGPSPEEQERLRELARRALEEQRLAKRGAADFDAQLFYSVYLEREDVNFALFNYVCEQNAEVEDLTKDMEQLKQAVELQRAGDAAASQEREDRRRNLEETREHIAQAASKLQAEAEKRNQVLRLIKAGMVPEGNSKRK